MKLVIAEKPMLARDIARAICGKPVRETEKLPISGNGYTVCACAGHLLNLVEPEKLDPKYKSWNLDDLPIYAKNWEKSIAADKKQLVDTIANLSKSADLVINAGDPDDEGQLIIDEVLNYIGYKGKVLRVFVNDNIEKNIVKAFDNLVDNKECENAGKSAYARQMADMCFGINESRLASIKLGSALSVGRVQTPTLGLVVNRDEQISGHSKRMYYELISRAKLIENSENIEIDLKFKPHKSILSDEKHIFDATVLENIKSRCEGKKFVLTTNVQKKQENPPLPFNLTTLQAEMSKQFKYSAKKTLDITQNLRDKYKAITYNRSDSQYLKDEHYDNAQNVLSVAMSNCELTYNLDYSIKSKAFNEKNVTAHHGIIPQEVEIDISSMTAEEKNVYCAIVKQYAMQFMKPAEFEESISVCEIDQDTGYLEYKTKNYIDYGYKAIIGEIDIENSQNYKVVLPGGQHECKIVESRIEEFETKPPKPYTEGTLIKDMSSISKYVKDPEIKAILKKKDEDKKGESGGIGTTATRAAIIEALKKRGFIEEVQGKIRSTEKGREFYHLIPDEIKSADVTAKWWLIQQEVENGNADVNDAMMNVVEIFNAHKNKAYEGKAFSNGNIVVGKCPLCGKDVLLRGKILTCSSNKAKKDENGVWKDVEGCGFKAYTSIGAKDLTHKQLQDLIAGKEVKISNLKSKNNKKYNAIYKIDNSPNLNGFYGYKFINFAK